MSISVLNRGASGGLKPELTVTAPAGSTIDLLQNEIIVDTCTLGTEETEHTFAVKVGTYIVRGTLGDKVQSKEVVIEIVGQYAVEIDYRLWLYREGDECENVTGGWKGYSGGNGSYSKGDTTLGVSSGANDGTYQGALITVNKIDVTNYNKLVSNLISVPSGGNYLLGIVPNSSHSAFGDEGAIRSKAIKDPGVIEVDISSATGFYYVGIGAINSVGWRYTDQIWFE